MADDSRQCERMPRLLILASTYPRWPGDPEPGFVHELAKRLTTEFHVTVLCPHARGAATRECLEGVDVVRYRYAPARFETLVNDGGIVSNLRQKKWKAMLVPAFLIGQTFQAWRLLRERRFDVIHAHWLIPQGLVAALLVRAFFRDVPFLVTSHGADLFALRARVWQRLKIFVLRRAGATAVVSEGMREEIHRLGIADSHVRVEPMGVDLKNTFTIDPMVPRSTSELLFVGRLVEKKGLRHLLEAMPLIRAVRPDVRLNIVGFGPELDARKAQVEELGLRDAVEFMGSVGQPCLPDRYRRAALFVAPFVEAKSGDQDGLGLVIVEALGCGCPVVVSEMPATRRLARQCAGVRVAPSGDAEALARVVLDALRTPPQVQLEDIADFDWSARARSYAALLRQVIARVSELRLGGRL